MLQSLLAADRLLWTVDKNLDALATRLGVAFRSDSNTVESDNLALIACRYHYE